MKLKHFVSSLTMGAVLFSGMAVADTAGSTGMLNYRWMNAVVNKTPVEASACPEINTDVYGKGFQVALRSSFYGSVAAIGSRWFPNSEIWSSVGVGPIKNDFAILSSNINHISELAAEKEKKLPDNLDEVNRWKVSDSAYWESNGGVSMYVGAGISPIDVGLFAVATGGWVNYFQKTGPNRVYVEMQKKKIRSLSFGVGIGRPNIAVDRDFESQKGYAFEFVLDNQKSIEAFERFMAGDMTVAQELSKNERSGVNKISNMSETYSSWARTFGISTPFIPVLAFKASTGTAYNTAEELSVWDESVIKDTAIYTKQKSLFMAGTQINEARSFVGGKITKDAPGINGRNQSETLFGNFKYSYQSNWGQEKRLRKYINKVKGLTGLVDETCATVPAFQDSLGYNQVVLEMNWSNEFVQELAGLKTAKSNTLLLGKIKAAALNYQADKAVSALCTVTENDSNDLADDACVQNSPEYVNAIFSNLEKFSNNMNKSFSSDKKEFNKNLAKFGQEVWKSPSVFKAFFERGKLCGQDFKFEVSGQRLTRHAINQKFNFSASCNK